MRATTTPPQATTLNQEINTMSYATPSAQNVLSIPSSVTSPATTLFRAYQGAKPKITQTLHTAKPVLTRALQITVASRHFVKPTLLLALTATLAAMMGTQWALKHGVRATQWAIGTLCAPPELPPTPETESDDPWSAPCEPVLSCPLPVHVPRVLLLAPSPALEATHALEGLTVAQLRKVGQSMGVPKARAMNRAALLAALIPA